MAAVRTRAIIQPGIAQNLNGFTLAGAAEAGPLLALDHALFGAVNALAGQSVLLDAFIGLALESNLVKAGVIGAAFMYAWFEAPGLERRRRVLIAALIASVAVVAVTKLMSNSIFLPRPYVQSQQAYVLDDGGFAAAPRLAYRMPNNDFARGHLEMLRRGEIEENDLGSFPSDHAGLFATIVGGILIASRAAGLAALAWLVLVTLGARVVAGQHSPLEVVVGAAIGIAILLPVQFIASRWGRRPLDAVVGWTIAHPALSAALLFLCAFEVTNVLDDVSRILRAGKQVAEAMGLA